MLYTFWVTKKNMYHENLTATLAFVLFFLKLQFFWNTLNFSEMKNHKYTFRI